MSKFLPKIVSKIMSRLFLALLTCVLLACASAGQNQDYGQNPKDETELRQRAKIRLELAVNYFQQNQLKIALNEVDNAIQTDPDFAQAHMMRGIILMDAGQTAAAESSLRQALRISPNDPDVNNSLGWFLCQQGREAESFPYFNTAAAAPFYASPAKPLQNAGICALRIKNAKQAEAYLARANAIEPNQAAIIFNLAKAYLAIGEYDRAKTLSDRVNTGNTANANTVWLALRIAHFRRDAQAKLDLASKLRRDYVASPEWALFQRGAFDE